jgi:hypothetical protein
MVYKAHGNNRNRRNDSKNSNLKDQSDHKNISQLYEMYLDSKANEPERN